jgi:hypothetical protein
VRERTERAGLWTAQGWRPVPVGNTDGVEAPVQKLLGLLKKRAGKHCGAVWGRV